MSPSASPCDPVGVERNRKLTLARERAGLSLPALARHASISADYMRKIERGDRVGGVDLWVAFADALGVSLDSLAGDGDAPANRGPKMCPVTGRAGADGTVMRGAALEALPLPPGAPDGCEGVVFDAGHQLAGVLRGDTVVFAPAAECSRSGSIVIASVAGVLKGRREIVAIYVEAAGFPVLAPCGSGQNAAIPLDGSDARIVGTAFGLWRGFTDASAVDP